MSKYLTAYIACAVVFLVIDYFWITYYMKGAFQDMVGTAMRSNIQLMIAALFYLFYAVGIVILCVMPGFEAQSVMKTMLYGAVFGFCAYATYDVTNFATLEFWTVKFAVTDVLWGTFLTALSATAGHMALRITT